jgi:hypothetical protein
MTTLRLGSFRMVTATIPLFLLAGCYTQFARVDDERAPEYASDTEEYADSSTQDEYEDARQSFYYDSYYPAIGIGLGYGWGYPWYGYRGYYDPFFEYGGYYRAGAFGWYQPNRYYGGYHVIGRGRRGPARTIGSTRTMGVSRGPVESSRGASMGSMGSTPALRSRRASPAVGSGNGVSVRPGVSTGRRGTAAPRTGGRSGSRSDVRPFDQYTRPAPAPAQGSGRSDAGNRGNAQPAYTPPPSPPPSAPPTSSGTRGGEDRGSRGSGNERGGSRR